MPRQMQMQIILIQISPLLDQCEVITVNHRLTGPGKNGQALPAVRGEISNTKNLIDNP